MKQNITLDPKLAPKGVVDFRYLLDAPAGKHGFAVNQDGRLHYEDGVRAKFVGFNISGGGGMPTRRSAERYAERMAAMGVNLVRPTLIDWPSRRHPTIYDVSDNTTQMLSDEMLDRFDYFFHCLKRLGIYLMLDLFTARGFLEGDDIEYYSERMPRGMLKAVNLYSPRMIELQKLYATQILHHVNPYTGLAYKDDPAVLLIQLVNENSLLWQMEQLPNDHPYFDMLQRLFNDYLLKQYGSRAGLAEAWTREGECALYDEEDPVEGTVRRIPFPKECQSALDYRSYYVGMLSPARYADYMAFVMELGDVFVHEMTDHIQKMGCRIPINTSNLSRGFVDARFTGSGDVAMNNAYFNHPLYGGPSATLFHKIDLITVDPRFARSDTLSFKSNQIQSLAMGALADKPFMVSEWNEYNANAFHSSFLPMGCAYMCLQDWDGMMIYTYVSTDDVDALPVDEQVSCYDCYNEPALAYQFGLAAEMFMGNKIAPAELSIDVCVSQRELGMLEPGYQTPYAYLPFIHRTRTRIYQDIYDGNADVAVSAGFLSHGDLTPAKHALVYARSPYADAYQKEKGAGYLDAYQNADAKPLPGGLGTYGERYAVLPDATRLDADCTAFSRAFDAAVKGWGLLGEHRGLIGRDTLVSDTGQIEFTPSKRRFSVSTEQLAVYSGYPVGPVEMGGARIDIHNAKMTLSLLSRDGKALTESESILLIALGEAATENTQWRGELLIDTSGKRWIDSLEGSIFLPGVKKAEAYAIDGQGEQLGMVQGMYGAEGVTLMFDGQFPTAWFHIVVNR